jgi:hypothetical protein
VTGDINRDWKNVDWHAVSSGFDRRVTVSATVNGVEIRTYEFDTGIPPTAAHLFNDMLAALKQHRGQE